MGWMKLLVGPIDPAEGKNVGSEDRIALSVRRGLGSKFAAGETGHLFSDPFPGPGRSSDGQTTRPRTLFLQLAHIGLLFFGNRAAERQAHQFLRLFAQLLALDGTQTFNLRFQSGFFFFQFSIFIGGFPPATASACWWRMASRRSLRRLISFFSTSFMVV